MSAEDFKTQRASQQISFDHLIWISSLFKLFLCLWLVEKHRLTCVCLSSARLSDGWRSLYLIIPFCQTHRACTLISNGAKHKQTIAPLVSMCMGAHFISIWPEEADVRQNQMLELKLNTSEGFDMWVQMNEDTCRRRCTNGLHKIKRNPPISTQQNKEQSYRIKIKT